MSRAQAKENNMDKKLIFLDIDGTLLIPGEMTVPQSAAEALSRARANGHKVFLCTGRNYRMTAPLLGLGCGFDGYICSAGGYVCCGGQILADTPMRPQDVIGLRDAMLANGVDCTLEAKDDTFGGAQMIERFAHIYKEGGALNSEAARWLKAMQDGMTVRPLSEYDGRPIYKIVYIAPNAASLSDARARYESGYVFCQYYSSSPDSVVNGELIDRRFNKGTGIKAICDHLGCSAADTIGFGDSDNDLQMAQAVGLSVCMANGSDNLKRVCSRVCPSVYDDGIAKEFAALGLV